MNCVGYDKDFYDNIISKNVTFEPKWHHDEALKKAAKAAEKAESQRAIAAGEIEDPKEKKSRAQEVCILCIY